MAALRTEFDFILPKGFIDADGGLHRDGTMRLATARDEIEPLRDRSVTGPDDPYLTVLVLARVITRIGSLDTIGTDDIESLFAADLAFLQDLYGIINFGDPADVEALQASVLPAETVADAASAPADVEVELADADGHDDGNAATSGSGAATGPARRSGRIEEVSRASSS